MQGGQIEEVKFGVVILCCEPLDGSTFNSSKLKHLEWGSYYKRLGHGQRQSRFMGMKPEEREWLEPAVKDQVTSRVVAYVRVDYTRPSNPVEPSEALRDAQSFWWNPQFSQWMVVTEKGNEMIEKVIDEFRVFDADSRTEER